MPNEGGLDVPEKRGHKRVRIFWLMHNAGMAISVGVGLGCDCDFGLSHLPSQNHGISKMKAVVCFPGGYRAFPARSNMKLMNGLQGSKTRMTPPDRKRKVLKRLCKGARVIWGWLKIKQEGLRGFLSMFPLARGPFWYRFFWRNSHIKVMHGRFKLQYLAAAETGSFNSRAYVSSGWPRSAFRKLVNKFQTINALLSWHRKGSQSSNAAWHAHAFG